MKRVLITGGSGLLGNAITEKLLNEGNKVAHLSTRKNYNRKGVDSYYWNTDDEYIDEEAFNNIDAIIHLAGANVASERWTSARKNEIIESRVSTTNLLVNYIEKLEINLNTFIGASAIGIYGSKGDELLKENAEKGDDFLADVCKVWEEGYNDFPAKRKVVNRIGIVLANEGGALKEMTKTLPFFVGVLGNGNQYYSWIHIDDLANAFVYALNNEDVNGVFNMVSPNPARQKDIAAKIGGIKNAITMPTPKFALNLVLGEMSQVVLMSQKCSAKALLNTGFTFKFDTIDLALNDLLQ